VSQQGPIVNTDFNPAILRLIIRRHWFWIPLLLFFFLAGAYTYLRYTKPVYESNAIIQLTEKDQGKEILGIENMQGQKSVSQAAELLRSEFLFQRAIKSLNIHISYFSKGKVLTEERYLQSTFIITPYALKDSSLCQVPIAVDWVDDHVQLSYHHQGQHWAVKVKPDGEVDNAHFHIAVKLVNEETFFNDVKENEAYFMFNQASALTARLLPSLEVSVLNPDAKTIQLIYKSNNAAMSKDIVEALYQNYFVYDEELEKQSSLNILNFIDRQLDSLNHELKIAKDSIQQFQRLSNIPNPEQMEMGITENVNTIQSEIFSIELELLTLRSLEKKISANPNRLEIYQLIPELIGTSFESSLFSQVEDLHRLLERKEDLAFSMTPESAEFKNVQARISQRTSSIRKSIEAIKERMLTKINILNDRLREMDKELYALPEKRMELSRLQNIQDLNEKYFFLLMNKRSEYYISNAGYATANVVLKPATVNNTPVSPNRKMIIGVAVFLGLMLSIGIIILRYLLHDEVNTQDDLQQLLPDLAILGSVPKLKNPGQYSTLVVAENPKSRMAEAFRTIRANLNFMKQDARLYAVSSSISGEGKTFVCINLAAILAMTGKRVVLLDLDLRKPKVHHGFGVNNENGMSKILVGQCDIPTCLKKSSLDNLYFITAGPIPPNPSELILSPKMDKVIEELKTMFDVIVIDNPPVGLVSDGIDLLSKADCPIYIFKADYSKRTFTHRVRELVDVQKIKGLGIILNAVEIKNGPSTSGYLGYFEEEQKDGYFKRLMNKWKS
jgi:tyrosine-protein kinase Etk/Wzc